MNAVTLGGFDVIVSDIGMPGASGIDLLRVVRAYDLDVPVILMTGSPDDSGDSHATGLCFELDGRADHRLVADRGS